MREAACGYNKPVTNWFAYIMLCIDRSIYIGIAKDPRKRFCEHVMGKGAAAPTPKATRLCISYARSL